MKQGKEGEPGRKNSALLDKLPVTIISQWERSLCYHTEEILISFTKVGYESRILL